MTPTVDEAAWRHVPLRVLLLEDSRFDAELLRAALEGSFAAATLDVVADEAAFTARLERGDVDIVLSDYELPGFSGAQALRIARRLVPETPFVFVSGVIGEDNAVEMLKQGATDYVSKGRLSRLPVVMARALREAADRRARALAEAKLREADQVLARVVDALHGYAVILLDTQGHIRSWNRAAHGVFGHPPPGPIGASVAILFTPEDRDAGVPALELRTALETGAADDDRWMLRADGVRFWAEGMVTPLHDARGAHSGYAKIVHDATESYRAAEALRHAKEAAERANRAKDRFLAVLSHELRTPLAPIASAAQALERAASVPAKLQGLLPMIRRNVALEARLIDDLLDLTAISAGKVSLRLDEVPMHKLLRGVLDMVAEDLRARRVSVDLQLEAVDDCVHGDAARLQQVLWNLVRNAVKFSHEGGTVHVSTRSHEGSFVLTCRDHGIGIAPEALTRIFTAFEQAGSEIAPRFGGLGLGLSIARGLVEAHHGALDASSDGPGRGATFTLVLPLMSTRRPAAPPCEPPPGQAAPDEGRRRVLLVEDNADAALALCLALEDSGYQVSHALTRAEALALAEREPPDVVVSDLGLPDGSGLELGRALAARVPLIALSGYGTPQDVRESTAAGFAAHLVKPVDPDVVHQAIQQVLETARAG